MNDEKKRSGRASGGALEGSRKPGLARRFFADDQGTASIEAVIMLPFFIIVWGLLLFAVDVYQHKINAGLQARDCGWSFAQTGCETLPPSCSEEPVDEFDTGDSASSSEITTALSGASEIPVVGDLLTGALQGIFGKLRIAETELDVQRPQVLGATTVHTTGSFAIMCNERPRTIGEMAVEMVCGIVPDFC